MNRKYREIDKTIASLNEATDAHFSWLVKVMFCLTTHDEATLHEVTHDRCVFGQWINSWLEEERDDRNFLLEINEKHLAFHYSCNVLVSDAYYNNPGLHQFNEFEKTLLELNAAISKYREYLLQLRTSYDYLTGVPLRRALDESFGSMLEKFGQDGIYLFLVDIDHFKKVNDNYGHLVGDIVLRSLAAKLEDSVRRSEPVFRYGGEEFIIIIHANNESNASAAADRIRKVISDTEIDIGGCKKIKVTFTGGLTRMNLGETLHQIVERADAALYHGKESGRNCCMYINKNRNISRI